MAYSFETKMIDYFPKFYKVNDTLEVGGKGIFERYNEVIGKHIDEDILPYINNLIRDNHVPYSMLSKYLTAVEESKGIILNIGTSDYLRRKVIQYLFPITSIKGTEKGYITLFRWLGYDATITIANIDGFDSGDGFDYHTFDSSSQCCFKYNVDLIGSVDITQEIVNSVYSIIDFNEPINAELNDLTLNGFPISILPHFDLHDNGLDTAIVLNPNVLECGFDTTNENYEPVYNEN